LKDAEVPATMGAQCVNMRSNMPLPTTDMLSASGAAQVAGSGLMRITTAGYASVSMSSRHSLVVEARCTSSMAPESVLDRYTTNPMSCVAPVGVAATSCRLRNSWPPS